MLNYHPKFTLATLSPPQTALVPKFGGLPWGLPLEKWPVCAQCGVPMALLMQLPHDPPRLDLGDPKWVLHAFICPGQGELQTYTFCDFWDWDGGANAVFVVDRADLGDGLVSHEDQPARHLEAFVTGWFIREDSVPEDEAEAYRDAALWRKLPDEQQFPHDFNSDLVTKFGGTPYWTGNGPMSFPARPFQFLFQIGTFLCADVPPADPKCSQVPEDSIFHDANFCSDGTAYIYLDRTADPPRAGLFINR